MIPEDFDQAEARLREFAASQGIHEEISWIFGEDILLYNRRLHVRLPLPQSNRLDAEELYIAARDTAAGVQLRGIARVEGFFCCAVDVPDDETDAKERMIPYGQLKLSVPVCLPDAVPVRSRTQWSSLVQDMRFSDETRLMEESLHVPFRRR